MAGRRKAARAVQIDSRFFPPLCTPFRMENGGVKGWEILLLPEEQNIQCWRHCPLMMFRGGRFQSAWLRNGDRARSRPRAELVHLSSRWTDRDPTPTTADDEDEDLEALWLPVAALWSGEERRGYVSRSARSVHKRWRCKAQDQNAKRWQRQVGRCDGTKATETGREEKFEVN
nr:hypothetical protein CFP56_58733 [Quercus suber]